MGSSCLGVCLFNKTSSLWFWTPKARKTIVFTREKMVVLAPMPRASVTIAAAVNPGLERSRRNARVRLWRSIAVPGARLWPLKTQHCQLDHDIDCPILGRTHSRSATEPLLHGCKNNLNPRGGRSEEHTSELQSLRHLVCRLLLEK